MLISEFFYKPSHKIIFSGYSPITEVGWINWINLCIDNHSVYEYIEYGLIFPVVFCRMIT